LTPPPVADVHIDPKIERANYESTHLRSQGSGSLKKDVRVEPADVASPPATNGSAPGADKGHKSGELHAQDESEPDAHSADRPKSDS